ncbi:glycosyltransferase [Chryseobacterium sp. RG1]|uniref:Glycosyltransferase n=1 Tax=Chryseobacterium tagetis TaxID=2801334 RepID=A0ABS8A5I6_9FLAO|nr:glycosyltransferase family 2 protein [Chryseobacterium tagetis]MCA6069102.1 glycosyltransferase [Chryseobacterium tagetis]
MTLTFNYSNVVADHAEIKAETYLSICIPTYNRVEKTFQLVKSILNYDGNDVEVIVVDNCSTDSTQDLLKTISDDRFKYLRNKEAIGGMPNILNSMTYASGEYVLLCLDKDHVLPNKISQFIDQIKKSNFSVGQCSLDSSEFDKNITYKEGIDSIINIAYTSEHPSGLFIKNNIIKEKAFIKNIVDKYNAFAFLPELLKAEVALYGGTAGRINMPFVVTETREECAKEISHTYKGNNIYFMPDNVIIRFNIFKEHIDSLSISAENKKKLTERIYKSLLVSAAIEYKNIMLDEKICRHHGINTRKVGKKEQIKYLWQFNRNFFNSNFSDNNFWKYKTTVILSTKLLLRILIKS